ncbi:hypothetical protein GGQ92_002439 [Gracilibacillus halotolerans]|uniref:Uncharacterized protein n=1 Tax=Gracilibacillus halotolerans TaxID=74386 RepID=A0A841RQY5_9BACI|nr:AimR family lysis-lysogeny pheromone receptor [Gracilibacillus halotolerans]MBB6513625.1 hypothetical protein [Gracilibacillus halotolerans]
MLQIANEQDLISHYLHHDTQLKFHQFLTMIQIENDEVSNLPLALQFLRQTTSETDLRLALEFCYINYCYDDLAYFIEKNEKSLYPLNRKYAMFYQLMLDIQKGASPQKIRSCVRSIQCDNPELTCLKYLVFIEVDLSIHHYHRIGTYIDKIQQLLNQLDHPLLVSFLQVRIQILNFYYYWKQNELILARKYAYHYLQMPYHIKQKAQIHLQLAYTYIYEDVDSSLYHLQEAEKIATSLEDKMLLDILMNKAYPFICAHFGIIHGVSTEDKLEKAHLEIVKGNMQKAVSLLQKLPEPTPFSQYYLGLATQQQDYHFQSYRNFIHTRKDHFFAKLPMMALETM